ncbi:glycosyltransferase family 2 protein [Paraflavisolibacter sp. H34]|uniref:glycosyltransferase family 2 protein n=1 Tax=Huijunlia imazamoxiresistens TaxID=3127457 RepID=UPI00301AA01F
MEPKFAPLVSVIIPFLNVAPYLQETVDSVLQQTYLHWEIILVDDGSTDGSTAIAQAYARQLPGKIVYAEHPGHVNKGAPTSRNLGISLARGEWIALLDSDDVWLPDKLLMQVNLLQANPRVEVLLEATRYWLSWCDPGAVDFDAFVGVPAERFYHPPELMLQLYPLGPGSAPCMCGFIMKTSALRAMGGFDETFTGKNQLFEDQAFMYKIYLSRQVYVSSLCNNIYRQRSNSLMHSLISEGYYLQGEYFFLKWLPGYMRRMGVSHPAIERRVREKMLLNRYRYLVRGLRRRLRKVKELVGLA